MHDLCQALDAAPWQVISDLQQLAAAEQLRVELSGHKAVAFRVVQKVEGVEEVDRLAEELVQRMGTLRKGGCWRLDGLYRALADAAAHGAEEQVLWGGGGVVGWVYFL